MSKINKHIEIVVTTLEGLGSMNSTSSGMIQKALEKHYTTVGVSIVNNATDLLALVESSPDLAFIGFKKVPSEGKDADNKGFIWIAEYLEDHGITTTGSDTAAIKREQDKTKAKDIVLEAGLATSPYFIAKQKQYTAESQLPLGFPLFLKPPQLGAGEGVNDNSVVRNFEEYEAKIDSLLRENDSPALVERYLNGREFTVAVMMELNSKTLMAMPIEQLPIKNSRGDGVIGHAMKNAVEETAVGMIEAGQLKDTVMRLATDVFTALGARDYGRIDIRLDENEQPQFLEANLIPGLIDGSGNFQKASQMNLGMNHEEMILHIVNLAFAREVQRA